MRGLAQLVLVLCALPCWAFAQGHVQPPGVGNSYIYGPPELSVRDVCVKAIAAIEPGTSIPPNLMGAISKVESGRADSHDGVARAWPWTINAEGRGAMFSTKAEAIAAVQAIQARGVASVDVGCMQVNLMHHPKAFASLDEAFDPAANVRYAARFLRELHAQTGDWNLAAAFYHSHTPALADAYRHLVLAQLPGAARVLEAARTENSLANAWAATLGSANQVSTSQPPLGFPRDFATARLAAPSATRRTLLASGH